MYWKMTILTISALLLPYNAQATCMGPLTFERCINFIYEKKFIHTEKITFVTGPQEENVCRGYFHYADDASKKTSAYFLKQNKCPTPETKMTVHVSERCLDYFPDDYGTEYEFIWPISQDYCTRSYEERLEWSKNQVQKINDHYKNSTNNDQVYTRKQIDTIFKEMVKDGKKSSKYYEHPNILIDVPFNKSYNNGNPRDPQNGTITIEKIKFDAQYLN